ncbi:Thiamine pyrophosphate enzyme C-terminal TPP-binding, partial [Penicillium samsonianum]|uniref:Thiamine pyrophosphate enzyme C-terminal TPP-binding n=1 Tax=Penicillium samsonianum TaxID=1882272 RepID=UPI0025470523
PHFRSDALATDRSASIKRCADIINKAQKPVIYAGNGVLSCAEGLKVLAQLAEIASIPVATSFLGTGCFDEHDFKSLQADLVIAVGTRFDDRAVGDPNRFAPVARGAGKDQRGSIIHFEIHPPHINKVIQCDEFVQGDVTAGLTELHPHVRKVESRPEWMGQTSNWKKTFPIKPTPPKQATRISPESVILLPSGLLKNYANRPLLPLALGHIRYGQPSSSDGQRIAR